ncbi:MAG: hypothetical protein ABL999_11160 [Pyrinomonadaceae bacterium]
MGRTLKIFGFLTIVLLFVSIAGAQVKKANARNPVEPKAAATPEPTPETKATPSGKRNERPAAGSKATDQKDTAANSTPPTHIYEFTRPGFSYGRIVIEHDDAGKGKISFLKDGYDEMLTDPMQISDVTLRKIADALKELNFLDSTEDYQYIRDYSHLGNLTFTLKQGERFRTVKYNWTENKGAKALMDEYRRISNEYTWRFEILLARQNMPLQTPSLMDAIDAYYRRGEISDPVHLLPFLTELSNDERLPLIARNRAAKMVKEIEKTRK